jgi:hypothetical protein
METLLIIVIALASILGLVVILSVSSLLFVQSKYVALQDSQREDEEAQQEQKITNSTPYIPHSVYTVNVPRIDDIIFYKKLEEVCNGPPLIPATSGTHYPSYFTTYAPPFETFPHATSSLVMS